MRPISWIPLAERFAAVPLILAGPMLRRVEPHSVTVWLALKEARTVTLRIYARNEQGQLVQQFEGTRRTVRLGDHLHVVAVTARATTSNEQLVWGQLYYYDLFFQPDSSLDMHAPETAPHLDTPGILNNDPSSAGHLHRLVYPGHSLPSFVLPPEDVNLLRIVHGSCRKPHGIGKEMLSALDVLLEAEAEHPEKRPQQLFMTGDQIYADDVATSLLFMLNDAGTVLCAGNAEEILPLVNVPSHALGPGGRTEVVRNKAMFTTTTPDNQLLSLSEYTAMYLFAWSDVLWPEQLPEADDIWQIYPDMRPRPAQQKKAEERYAAHSEQLHSFRSTLPQVRRALANIATYTIFDDHDVTDDWYLDGAWCRRVLASPLGRRVIRNALLAYTLFQAWGNTPEQFDEGSGAAFLQAMTTWRGDESDPRVKTLECSIGMPSTFAGRGELQHWEQALHWHYTFSGPRYQIIVMDTRTQRLYRSPDEFPGLLSPSAMNTQVVAAARKDVDVTLVISATPVLGIDFVETVQFWSRWRVKDNYTYDREAWALEWGTFQAFLKIMSEMEHLVFLSGDVHYAFGASLEYWDYHTQKTAKMVNYTSSSLHNEGSGAQIAVLAVGYPRLLYLLRREGTPTIDFFAWDIASNHYNLNRILSLIRTHPYKLWWSIPRLIAALRSPYEIVMRTRGWPKGAFDAFPPDRSYRLRYLRNIHSPTATQKLVTGKVQPLPIAFFGWMIHLIRTVLGAVIFLETQLGKARNKLLRRATSVKQTQKALQQPAHVLAQEAIKETERLERHLAKRRRSLVERLIRLEEEWLDKLKAGALIVGYNNIGDISFDWVPGKKDVIQRLWWCHPNNPDRPTLATEYRATLELPERDASPPLP
ncbi:MAG: hypothetical protein ACXVCM_25900 [Ktedonobacteraceae bacterium]